MLTGVVASVAREWRCRRMKLAAVCAVLPTAQCSFIVYKRREYLKSFAESVGLPPIKSLDIGKMAKSLGVAIKKKKPDSFSFNTFNLI